MYDLQADASMRPGPIGPGNARRARRAVGQDAVASMRPGPIGPGNATPAPWHPTLRTGFNAARPNWAGKSAEPERAPHQLARLQCGPAQLGREISSPRFRGDYLRSFNAARPNWAGK